MEKASIKQSLIEHFESNPLLAWIVRYSGVLLLAYPVIMLMTQMEAFEGLLLISRPFYYLYLVGIVSCFIQSRDKLLAAALTMRALYIVILLFSDGFTFNNIVSLLIVLVYLVNFNSTVKAMLKRNSKISTEKKAKLEPHPIEEEPKQVPVNEECCTFCGTAMLPDEIFCIKCGKQRNSAACEDPQVIMSDPTDIVQIDDPNSSETYTYFCGNCGTGMLNDERFCLHCGEERDYNNPVINSGPVETVSSDHNQAANDDVPYVESQAESISECLESSDNSIIDPQDCISKVDEPVDEKVTEPIDPLPPRMMFCMYCGTPLVAGGQFCIKCGKKTE